MEYAGSREGILSRRIRWEYSVEKHVRVGDVEIDEMGEEIEMLWGRIAIRPHSIAYETEYLISAGRVAPFSEAPSC
jgi:hypothetical protein